MAGAKTGTTKSKSRGGLPTTPAKREKAINAIISEALENNGVAERPRYYTCSRCGLTTMNPGGKFFVIKAPWVEGNDGYSTICMDCAREAFEMYRARFRDERLALLLTCSLTGHYFAEQLYIHLTNNDKEFALGVYFRLLNTPGYNKKSFGDNLVEWGLNGRVFVSKEEAQVCAESRWRESDKRNRTYVLSTVGYDCFDDESYTSEDKRFLYNTLASYLSDEAVAEDGHKRNCVISIVKSLWQIDKIEQLVNDMLRNPNLEGSAIQRLLTTKNSLQTSVNTTARANGISEEGNSHKAGRKQTLTGIMKELMDEGFDDVKANVVDATLRGSYQELAQINARALMDELNFTGDEYAKMVAEQSEVNAEQAAKLMETEEALRLARIEIRDLKEKLSKQWRPPAEDEMEGEA